MLKKRTNNEDTYIIKKEYDYDRIKFLDNYNYEYPINENIDNKTILVLDSKNNNTIKLKWMQLEEHEYVKILLNMIEEIKRKNIILEKEISILQNTNKELIIKTNNNENNIIKVNKKILEEEKINEIISQRINMLSVCINKKINEIENIIKKENNYKEEEKKEEEKDEMNKNEKSAEEEKKEEENKEEEKKDENENEMNKTGKSAKAKTNIRKKNK